MSETPPDWVTQTPNLPSLHTMPGGSNQLVPPMSPEDVQRFMQFFLTAFIGQVAIAFGGIEIAGWKPFEFLAQWGQGVVDQASAAYTGQQQANNKLDTVGSLFGLDSGDDFLGDIIPDELWQNVPVIGKLLRALDGIDLNGDPGAILRAIADALEEVPGVGDIVKLVRKAISGGVPINTLTDDEPNLLPESLFSLGSIPENGRWTVDPANSRTSDSSGAAKVIADGTAAALRSGDDRHDTIPVTVGRKFVPKIYVKHTGYAGTGAPIQLQVIPFTGDTEGAPVVVDSYAPIGPNLAWPGHQLTGEYTVPTGVTAVQVRLYLGATATAGTIWWDDAESRQTGVPGSFQGILDLLNLGSWGELNGLNPATIWSTIINKFLNPSQLLEDSTIRGFVKGLLDTLTGVLRLIPFVGNDLADSLNNFADGMDALNQTNIGNSATIAQIQAALGAGVPDADDFERTSLGPNWRVITSGGGSVTIDGHNLVMGHNDNTDYVLLKTDKLAGSDFQTCEIVLGSAPGYGTVVVDSARGHNDIWLRCSDFTNWATRTGIRCRWSGQNKNIKLSAFVNGSEVVTLFNAAVATASAGSRLAVEAGVNGTQRRFVIRVNGSLVAGGDVVESGTASQYGATYRRRGLGGATEHLGVDPFAISPDPGTVMQWTATG